MKPLLTIVLLLALVFLVAGSIGRALRDMARRTTRRLGPLHDAVNAEIRQYFGQFTGRSEPPTGTKPVEVVWNRIGVLELKGSRLCIGDSWALPGDGLFVAATPGRYDLSAECFSYGSDARIARLRVQLAGSAPDAAVPAGQFSVDVASAGVTDGDLIDQYANQHPDDHDKWAQSFSDWQAAGGDDIGFFPHDAAGTTMAYVPTGFGDGTYAVQKLVQGDRPVGLEAVFLPPGAGYLA